MAKSGPKTKYTPEKIKIVLAAAAEMLEQNKFVTEHELSRRLECAIRTIDLWEAAHPDFAAAMEEFSGAQKSLMIKNGLSGEYNPVFTKFVLSASYGMSEKNTTALEGSEQAPLTIRMVTDSDGE